MVPGWERDTEMGKGIRGGEKWGVALRLYKNGITATKVNNGREREKRRKDFHPYKII
jgi:hypothetical protein